MAQRGIATADGGTRKKMVHLSEISSANQNFGIQDQD